MSIMANASKPGKELEKKRIAWNQSSVRNRFESPASDSFAPIRLPKFFFQPATIHCLAGEWGQANDKADEQRMALSCSSLKIEMRHALA